MSAMNKVNRTEFSCLPMLFVNNATNSNYSNTDILFIATIATIVVVLWCCGAVVPCGAVVLWCCGAVVLWCCGAVVPCGCGLWV
jgi:hypothetical protein